MVMIQQLWEVNGDGQRGVGGVMMEVEVEREAETGLDG